MEFELQQRAKSVEVRITKTLDRGKWVIRIHGVTSGFTVFTETDDSTIEFYFDAERFNPYIRLK